MRFDTIKFIIDLTISVKKLEVFKILLFLKTSQIFRWTKSDKVVPQPVFFCSKSTTKTTEHCLKYVQS